MTSIDAQFARTKLKYAVKPESLEAPISRKDESGLQLHES